MSFRMVAQAFDMRVGNPLRKMVLIKLADQANDDGCCWPSYDSLSHACEVSKRSVIDHIKWLEEKDFLRIEKRYNKEKQKNETNRYHLTLDKAVQFFDKKAKSKAKSVDVGTAGAAPLSDEGVVQELHQGSAGAAPGSAAAAPKPINESIIESTTNNSENKIICDSDSKNELVVTSLTDGELLVEFWNSHRPAKAAVKTQVWAKVVKTRLKTFTAEEIKQAMLYVIHSHWHQNNGQVAIKNAIDSDKRCADAIEKQSQKQPVSQNQGNNHDNSQQPVNKRQSHSDKLRARINGQQSSEQSNNIRTVVSDAEQCH
ncbi:MULTISPECIES: helix-turn-helix domain-containing protein [unclassified Psychrobacter]|uniref:helix-turn-helix domain-containing protein n=2 Tax=Psychrobacter TaxID=497 RepID=UPI003FB8DF54